MVRTVVVRVGVVVVVVVVWGPAIAAAVGSGERGSVKKKDALINCVFTMSKRELIVQNLPAGGVPFCSIEIEHVFEQRRRI